MDLRKLAYEVCDIAEAAGAVILDVYKASEGMVIEKKADDSPLTIADQKANRIICDRLEQLDPLFPIVSEENKEIPYETRKNFEYSWLVDPLDGTKEFIKRNGEFTVNIALVHEGRTVLGVVYIPVTNETFWAAKGEGAYQRIDATDKPLHAASFKMKDAGLKLVCSRSHLNDETQTFVDGFESPELVSRGSSLKFLILAQGEAHIYPRLAPTMEWDTGAAQIILEEAGGKVISAATNNALDYNKENLRNPHFIAYGAVQE